MKCKHSKSCKYYNKTSYTCNQEQIKENGNEYCGYARKKSKSLIFSILFSLTLLMIGGVLGVGTYPALDPNMVLYYHFNNDSAYGENDTHVFDFSGNGNNGTIFGVTPHNNTGGWLGDGDFIFNGSKGNYISVPHSDSLDLNTSKDYTVSAWVKMFHTDDNTNTAIVEKWSTGSGQFPLAMRYTNATGGFTCGMYNGTTTIGQAVTNLDYTGNYHLVTCVYNVTNVAMYIDDILINTGTILLNGYASTNNTSPINIGSRSSTSNPSNGSIDEVIIFNKSLTAIEIGDIYKVYWNRYYLNYTSNTLNITYEITPQFDVYGGFGLDDRQRIFNGIFINTTYNGNNYYFRPFTGGLSLWLNNSYRDYKDSYTSTTSYSYLKSWSIISQNSTLLSINYTFSDYLNNKIWFIVNYTLQNKSLVLKMSSPTGDDITGSFYAIKLGSTGGEGTKDIFIERMPERNEFVTTYKKGNVFVGLSQDTNYSDAYSIGYANPVQYSSYIDYGATGVGYIYGGMDILPFSGGLRRGINERFILTVSDDYFDLYQFKNKSLSSINRHGMDNQTIFTPYVEVSGYNLNNMDSMFLNYYNLLGFKDIVFEYRISEAETCFPYTAYPIPSSIGGESAYVKSISDTVKYGYIPSTYFSNRDIAQCDSNYDVSQIAQNYSQGLLYGWLATRSDPDLQFYVLQPYYQKELGINQSTILYNHGIRNFYYDVMTSSSSTQDRNISHYVGKPYADLNMTIRYSQKYTEDTYNYVKNNLSIVTWGEGSTSNFQYVGIPDYFFAHRSTSDQLYTNNFPDIYLNYMAPYSGMVTTRGATGEIPRYTLSGISDDIEFWEIPWIYMYNTNTNWVNKSIIQYYYLIHAIQKIQQPLDTTLINISYYNGTDWLGLSDYLRPETSGFNSSYYMYPFIREIHPSGLNIYVNKNNSNFNIIYNSVNYTIYPNMTIAWNNNNSFFEYFGTIGGVNVSIVESDDYVYLDADSDFTWDLLFHSGEKYAQTSFDFVNLNRKYDNITILTSISVNNGTKVYYRLGNDYKIKMNLSDTSHYMTARLYNNQSSEKDNNVLGSTENVLNNSMNQVVTGEILNGVSTLFTNSTSLCNGSTGLMTGNVNITLNPNEYCYVLDNFNLTEGINREYSPIWFSSSTDTEKHVASNLTEPISIQVNFDVATCESLGAIRYKSDTGAYSQDFYPSDYSCNNNVVTINSVTIETASNSNEFLIEYGCNSIQRAGYLIVMIFASLILVLFCSYFVWKSYQEGEINIGTLIMFFITIIVSLVLWTASGQNLGNSCGTVG
jgi:hypothetical protein